MPGIALGDVAKCSCLGSTLFGFYLEGCCKMLLRLTDKKNRALQLVAEAWTEK